MSTDKFTSPAIRDAGVPYADNDADIILRSSDSVDFRAHRFFLSKASPVFADMFSLPSGDAVAGDELKDNQRVIVMSEDEASLRILLGCCYLLFQPVILEQMGDAERALVVGDKFQFAHPRALAVEWFNKFAHHDYERAYAFGWKMRSHEVVHAAALASLLKPHIVALPTSSDMVELPGVAILNLFAYQRACLNAAQAVLDLRSWYHTEMISIKLPGYKEDWFPLYNASTIRHRKSSLPHDDYCSASTGSFTGWYLGDVESAYVMPATKAYMDAALVVLKTSARGAAIDNESIIHSAYIKAVHKKPNGKNLICEGCAQEAAMLIPPLARLLGSEVEKAVAQIPLELPF